MKMHKYSSRTFVRDLGLLLVLSLQTVIWGHLPVDLSPIFCNFSSFDGTDIVFSCTGDQPYSFICAGDGVGSAWWDDLGSAWWDRQKCWLVLSLKPRKKNNFGVLLEQIWLWIFGPYVIVGSVVQLSPQVQQTCTWVKLWTLKWV